MSLISEQDKQEIRASIKEVTDTFFITPIIYKRAIDSLDVYQEDRNTEFEELELNVLYEDHGNEITKMLAGSSSKHIVKLTFNFDDLDTLGLINDLSVNFNETTDFVIVHNKKYRVVKVGYDGPLEPRNVLIYVIAKIEEKEYE